MPIAWQRLQLSYSLYFFTHSTTIVYTCKVFLKNITDFAAMNAVYGEYFSSSENKPARSTVEVARLPKDVLIEIECVATYE